MILGKRVVFGLVCVCVCVSVYVWVGVGLEVYVCVRLKKVKCVCVTEKGSLCKREGKRVVVIVSEREIYKKSSHIVNECVSVNAREGGRV